VNKWVAAVDADWMVFVDVRKLNSAFGLQKFQIPLLESRVQISFLRLFIYSQFLVGFRSYSNFGMEYTGVNKILAPGRVRE